MNSSSWIKLKLCFHRYIFIHLQKKSQAFNEKSLKRLPFAANRIKHLKISKTTKYIYCLWNWKRCKNNRIKVFIRKIVNLFMITLSSWQILCLSVLTFRMINVFISLFIMCIWGNKKNFGFITLNTYKHDGSFF